MKKTFGFNYITVIGSIFALCVAGYMYLVKAVVPQYIQQMLPVAETVAQDYINGSVKIGDITWNGGLSAEVHNVVVKDLQQQKVAVVPKTRVHFRPWMATIAPVRALSKIEILDSELWLRMEKEDRWNLDSILKPSESSESPFYGQVEVERGKLHVATPYGNWDFDLAGSVDAGANPKYDFKAQVKDAEEEVTASGLMTTKGVGQLQVNTKKVSLGKYASLVKHYTDIKDFAGELLNTHIKWDNNGEKNLVSGATSFANVGGKYTVGKEDHSFVLEGNVKATDSLLDIERLETVIDLEQKLGFKGKVDVHDLENVAGQGLVTSPKLSYKSYAIEKLHLPITLSKKLLQIDKASLSYGGGEVRSSATVDLREDTVTADVTLENINHVLSANQGDVLKANGSLAILGRKENKEGRDTFQIHVGADSFDVQWQDVVINKLNLDGDFDGKKLTIDHFSARTGEGVLAVKGSVVPEENGALAIDGRMTDFAIDPVLNHFANVQGKGKLSMAFKLSGTTSSPEFGTGVQLRDVDVLEHQLKEMHGYIGMKDNVLTIKRLGATQTKGRHILDGTVDFRPKEPVLNLDLQSWRVRVEPIVALVTKDYSLTGNLNNKMHISGTVEHPRIEGELDLTDGSIETYLYNGVSGKYLYNDGFVKLEDIIVKLFIADVKLDGTMTKDKKLDFAIAAHNIDIAKSAYRSKNYLVDGLINFDGRVGGTVAAPLFDGEVASKSLKVNGEAFTDIAGSVKCDLKTSNSFDLSFKQPYQNEEGDRLKGEGSFKANGNADFVQEFVTGTVKVVQGDVAGILRTNKVDFAVDGYVNGTLEICPEGKDSGYVFSLDSNNISTHKLKYDVLSVKGSYKDNLATIQEVLLVEKKATPDKGFIKASGVVDMVGSNTKLEAKAVEANPAIVNVAMKDPLDIKGALNLEGELTGSLENPKAQLVAEIVKGSLMGVIFDQAKTKIRLQDDNLYVDELEATKDVYGITGSGKIPRDALRAKADRKNPEAEMDVALDFEKAELGILTAIPYFDWGSGNISGKLDIKGTLDEPKVYGDVKVEDGTVKIAGLNPVLEHIKVDAVFDGNKATLNNASLELGKKGSVVANGYYLLNSAAEDAYRINIAAKEAEISYTTMFAGRINSELEITPQSYRDYWHNTAAPKSNIKLAKLSSNKKGKSVNAPKAPKAPIYLGPRWLTTETRPLIKGYVRLDDVLANVVTLGDDKPGSETNLGLDLKIELGPKIHMLNAMFYDIWLKGELGLKGGYYSQTTLDEAEDEEVIARHNRGRDGLKITGGIEAIKGSITYLRTVFKLTEAKLKWQQPGEILPHVKLSSWSRFGRYHIFANIDGSLGNITEENMLKLASAPPLERNTIIRMLTLQRESASGGNDVSNDDMNNVMSAGLQMALLGNVELWVKQTLGLDQFRVYTGKVNAGLAYDGSTTKNQLTNQEKNRYNVLISKYLTDKFMVGYTTAFNAEERAIFGQYDIDEHFALTYSDKRKKSGERKGWYGVEYSIDF